MKNEEYNMKNTNHSSYKQTKTPWLRRAIGSGVKFQVSGFKFQELRFFILNSSFFISLFLLASTARAQTFDIGDYSGRPGVGTGTSVTPKNKLLWETGLEYNHVKEHGYQDGLWTLNTSKLRYGLSNNTEVFADVSYFLGEVEDHHANGFGPLTLGTTLRVCEENGIVPRTVFITKLMLPTGAKEFRTEEIAPAFHISFSYSLSDRLSMTNDIGFDWDGTNPKPITLESLSFSYSCSPRFGLYAESYNYFRKYDRPDFNAGLGCTYQLNKHIIFDLLGVIDLNKNDTEFGVSFGLCWLLNNK